MGERDPRSAARRRAEDRVACIRCELALGEACGAESGGVCEGRELEEELLEELAELELALLKGDFVPNAAPAW